jgi:hypothetical protein
LLIVNLDSTFLGGPILQHNAGGFPTQNDNCREQMG